MAAHNIVVLAGDHCGPEVIAEGIWVWETPYTAIGMGSA